jgi:hypothetical protein
MIDIIAILFDDVHPSKVKLTLFREGNCFLIASTISAYSLGQMLLKVVADRSTRPSCNALYDHHSTRFHTVFHGIWTAQNPNMMYWFHVSWWNSEVSKSFSANWVRFDCHFNQCGSSWMSNLIFLCKHTIIIPRLHYLFKMAKAVSSNVDLVNSVTSVSVNLFNFEMWAFATKCFPIELVPCSDGWQRTGW